MDCVSNAFSRKNILFLQGPITPFFKQMADHLEQAGCRCFRINLCFGDWLFWRGRDSVQYRGSSKNWPTFLENFLEQNEISDIVLLGEQRYYHKIAIELAGERNIQVVTTDFGYLRPDWITFERNGMSSNSDFPRDPELIKELAEQAPPLDNEQQYKDSFVRQIFWDVSYHILSTLLRPLYPGYRSHQIYHPVWVYLGTGLRLLSLRFYWGKKADRIIDELVESNDPYMVFPLQMQNDFQIRAYSRFDNIQQAIDETIESFARQAPENLKLVFKVHPLDPAMFNWRRYIQRVGKQFGVENRLVYIDGGCLDTLIEGSHGVVTINSTVGIWALRQRKPVCALGEAIYCIDGLIAQQIDDFWRAPPEPDAELLDAFLRGIVSHLHIRGVYYAQPGLQNAVEQAVQRLLEDKVNQLMLLDTATQNRVAEQLDEPADQVA